MDAENHPRAWGCFHQAQLTAAAFAVVPTFFENHVSRASQVVSAGLGLLAGVGCLVAIVQLDHALARRFVYDHSEPPKLRSERARNVMATASLLLSILWAALDWFIGHGIVALTNAWFAKS